MERNQRSAKLLLKNKSEFDMTNSQNVALIFIRDDVKLTRKIIRLCKTLMMMHTM